MIALFEKHRPRTLDSIVGQPKAVAQVSRILDQGAGGQSFWISGPSGTGKTTLAEIIARSLADDWCIVRFDTADALDAQALDEMDIMLRTFAPGRGGRAFIINEAHALTGRAIRTLLGMLERIPPHVVFLFTTTREGQDGLFEGQIDAGPLLSRCVEVRTTNQGFARPMAERLKEIAHAESLGADQPIEFFLKIVQETKNNARAAIQRIASGAALKG